MADVPWRSSSSPIPEILYALNELLEKDRTRRSVDLEKLRASAARLDALYSVSEATEPVVEAPRASYGPTAARPEPQAEVPFVPLPRRTTHGGNFGPAVRAKLIAEALER